MATMTHPVASRAPIRLARHATVALLLWAATAVAVLLVQRELASLLPALIVAAKSFLIAMAGFAYVRLTRDCSIDHALAVGACWLTLGIATEVLVSTSARHTWFTLLGSPARPYLRDVLLFSWVAAPALFARRKSKPRSRSCATPGRPATAPTF